MALLQQLCLNLAGRGIPFADQQATSLLGLAESHGLASLMAGKIQAWPPTLADDLLAARRAIALRNLHLTQALCQLDQAMRNADLPYLAYKGPSLAALAYADLAARPYLDLDILVAGEHLPRYSALMQRLGYRLASPVAPESSRQVYAAHYETSWVRPGDGVHVELKWRLAPRFFCLDFTFAELWQHAVPVTLGSARINSMQADYLFVILCAHAAKHLWGKLLWLYDLDGLLSHGTLDPEAIMALAQRKNLRRHLAVATLLLEAWLARPLPTCWLQAARQDRTAKVLAERLSLRLARQDTAEPGVLAMWRWHTAMRERLQDRLLYTLELMLRPSEADVAALPLPDWAAPLRYPLRPWRLLASRLAGGN